MEDESEFLDFLVPRIELLDTEQLERVLNVALGETQFETDKIGKYRSFIEDTMRRIDTIPLEHQQQKNKLLINIRELRHVLNTYTGGPLKGHKIFIRSINNLLANLNLKMNKKEKTILLYHNFIETTSLKLPSLPDSKKKQTIIRNFNKLQNELEQFKSSSLITPGRKIRDYKKNIIRSIEILENPPVSNNNKIVHYYEFIEKLEKNVIPSLDSYMRINIEHRLNHLKSLIQIYEQDPRMKIKDLPKDPNDIKSNIIKTIKRIQQQKSSSSS